MTTEAPVVEEEILQRFEVHDLPVRSRSGFLKLCAREGVRGGRLYDAHIAEIARCPNVVAKLGGLAMPDNGFGWNERAVPPTSDEFVETQRRYYLHTIECFGPERCMFGSDWPVCRLAADYQQVCTVTADLLNTCSPAEMHRVFGETAVEYYRLATF